MVMYLSDCHYCKFQCAVTGNINLRDWWHDQTGPDLAPTEVRGKTG